MSQTLGLLGRAVVARARWPTAVRHAQRTLSTATATESRRVIDLRSDTVTLPTENVRKAALTAPLGDDVYGEDPTVKELEETAADMFGMEKALFVPTGTMGNLICMASGCQRGDEVICGDKAHIYHYEGGGASVLMGVAFHPIPNLHDGSLDLVALDSAVRPNDPHYTRTAMVALENTHNMCGGRVVLPQHMNVVADFAQRHGLHFHVDGARLANAAVALELPMASLLSKADSVSLCLSKGLGAPVGSIIGGSDAFMYRARRLRKMLGGGMRQAGYVAGAALVALKENMANLAQDHSRAQYLAKALDATTGLACDVDTVDTNIVNFRVTQPGVTAGSLIDACRRHGVLMGFSFDTHTVRAVTHLSLEEGDVEQAVERIQQALASEADP